MNEINRIRLFNSENDKEKIVIAATLDRIGPELVKLTSEDTLPDYELFSSGFEIIDENNMGVSGNYYRRFNTVYEKSDDKTTITLSKDGSISQALLKEIETNKENKITESKILLAAYLENNPLVSNCHNGTEAQYTVTSEKQMLMSSNYMSYKIAKELGIDAILTWNAAGCECEIWTEEEYLTLILQITEYVKPLVSLQQAYEVQIRNCKTQKELDEIVIAYE